MISFFMRPKKKNWSKKHIALLGMLCLAATVFLFWGIPVLAQDDGDPLGVTPLADTGLSSDDPRLIVAKIIRAFLGVLGIIGLVICVYAGYLWMTSQGDEAKVEKAKQLLVNGAIGLFIILSSYAIVSFIIHLLLTSFGPMQGEPPVDRDALGRGALGAGVIQSHYPPRDATRIPRNTNIIITFKVPMDLDSIALASESNGMPGIQWNDTFKLWLGDTNPDGPVGPDTEEFNLEISLSETPDRLFDARVYVLESEFNAGEIQTLVIDPDEYLGSPTEELQHKVELKSGIRTKAGQEPFKLFSYIWEFETSIVLDFTPPVIEGMERLLYNPPENPVFPPISPENLNIYQAKRGDAQILPFPYPWNHPCNEPIVDRDIDDDGEADDADGDGEPDLCRTWPRNVLIQLNFNEAVNPITVAGRDSFIKVYANQYGIEGDPGADDDITDWIAVDGEWRMSSDYKSIEFWPSEEDGINSCGEKIFILPGPSVLRVYLIAATPQDPDPASPNYTPQVMFPWDGVVDVASNALDGNADTFATSGLVDGGNNFSMPPTSYNLVDDDFDDFVFVFDTSSEIDLTSPILIGLEPGDRAEYVSPHTPFKAEFNKFMSTTSLLPNDTVIVWGREEDPENPGTPWERCTDVCNIQGTSMNYISTTLRDGADDGDEVDHHQVNITHEILQTEPTTVYAPILTKGIKDMYQNCYEGACKTGVDGDPAHTPSTDPYDPNAGPPELPPVSAGCTAYE